MWHTLGIGPRVADWLDKAAIENLGLLLGNHPDCARLDAVLGRPVSLGISEAHELELRIEAVGMVLGTNGKS